MTALFAAPGSHQEVEEGLTLAPRFDADGLVTCVVTDDASGTVLMLAHMNAEALAKTIETGEAHYYSRSRKKLWKKGEESGHVQTVTEMRVDCDQDAILLKVRVAGAGLACHRGYRSCFYRTIPTGQVPTRDLALVFDGGMRAGHRFGVAKDHDQR